jgi:hypothetical protein
MEINNTVLIHKDSAVIQKTGSGYVDFELLPTVSEVSGFSMNITSM